MTKVEVCNLALSHIGSSKTITDIDERSNEAAACRAFFDSLMEKELRGFPWSFAKKNANLAVVGDSPYDDEWDYAYRLPPDYLMIRWIFSGIRTDARNTRVPYEIQSDDQGNLILTDMQDARLKYVAKFNDYNRWPSDFLIAFSFKLAVYIQPRIQTGDPAGLRRQNAQLYEVEMATAKANSANEIQPDDDADTESIAARES